MSTDLGPEYPKFRPVKGRHEFTREEEDRMTDMLFAALAESGHPVTRVWDPTAWQWALVPSVPWAVLYRAREIVSRTFGVDFHWEDEDGNVLDSLPVGGES